MAHIHPFSWPIFVGTFHPGLVCDELSQAKNFVKMKIKNGLRETNCDLETAVARQTSGKNERDYQ